MTSPHGSAHSLQPRIQPRSDACAHATLSPPCPHTPPLSPLTLAPSAQATLFPAHALSPHAHSPHAHSQVLCSLKNAVGERTCRLRAFKECATIQRALSLLVEAAASGRDGSAATGLRRTEFLNLHLSIARAGYFSKPQQCTRSLQPYCWVPPPAVLKEQGREQVEEGDAYDDEEDLYGGRSGPDVGLRPWEEALAVWRLVHVGEELPMEVLTVRLKPTQYPLQVDRMHDSHSLLAPSIAT